MAEAVTKTIETGGGRGATRARIEERRAEILKALEAGETLSAIQARLNFDDMSYPTFARHVRLMREAHRREPGRSPGRTKTEVVHLRVTGSERAALDYAAARRGEKLSAFLRTAGLYHAGLVTREEVEAEGWPGVAKSLRGAAINLNQLARAANRGRIDWSNSDREVLIELLDAVTATREAFEDHMADARRRSVKMPRVRS